MTFINFKTSGDGKIHDAIYLKHDAAAITQNSIYILVNSPLNTFLFVTFTQNILKLRPVEKNICSYRS
jgi:hypothetical protein